jgi:hypothetical protein
VGSILGDGYYRYLWHKPTPTDPYFIRSIESHRQYFPTPTVDGFVYARNPRPIAIITEQTYPNPLEMFDRSNPHRILQKIDRIGFRL